MHLFLCTNLKWSLLWPPTITGIKQVILCSLLSKSHNQYELLKHSNISPNMVSVLYSSVFERKQMQDAAWLDFNRTEQIPIYIQYFQQNWAFYICMNMCNSSNGKWLVNYWWCYEHISISTRTTEVWSLALVPKNSLVVLSHLLASLCSAVSFVVVCS